MARADAASSFSSGFRSVGAVEIRPSSSRTLRRRLAPILGSIAALAIFAGALYLLHHKVAAYQIEDVRRALRLLSWGQVLAALGVAAGSYALFAVYDLLALRHIGKRLPYGRVALASFTSYAFVHSFGFGSLLHAAIRYRLYGPLGLRTGEIAEVTAFVNITFMIGLAIVLPAIALIDAPALEAMGVPQTASLAFAAGALALAAAYAALGFWVRRPLNLFGHAVTVPRPSTATAQIGLSLLDLSLAGAVIFLCLPGFGAVSYWHVLAVFVVALTAGIVSHVPGGIGVFDTVVLVGLGDDLAGDAILAGLLVFRIVYFLVPLLAAGALFGVVEAMSARRRLARASQSIGAFVAPVAPFVLAGCTFVSGAVLLFSNATPEAGKHLRLLYRTLPLHVVEASHFIGSIVGILLLLLAARLQRRSHAAWMLTVVLLVIGSATVLLKGLEWAQAAFLLLFFLILLAARDEFYIRSSLVANRFTPGWFLAIGVVLGSAFWLGLFSYKRVRFGDQPWWDFALYGDASRFLRASTAVAVVALVAAVRQLLGAVRHAEAPPDSETRPLVAEIVAASPDARANLALLGDKAILLHSAADALLMYRVSGRSWVGFGDPIGPPERWRDLFVRLDALARRDGGWPVFFGIGEAGALACRKLGFAVRKYGEAAIVPLGRFELEHVDPGLALSHREMAERGWRFETISADALHLHRAALDALAAEWERRRGTREDEHAMSILRAEQPDRFPIAIVRANERIQAFAVLSRGAGNAELSVELMRHAAALPPHGLDFLLVETILWAKGEGCRTLNLGIVPLRGLDRRHARSRWSSVGMHVFPHAEHFSTFAELRRAIARFRPDWEPRFVSSRGGLPLARALPDIAQLRAGVPWRAIASSDPPAARSPRR
jgi:phosphatidylglycerol lysyltransferase